MKLFSVLVCFLFSMNAYALNEEKHDFVVGKYGLHFSQKGELIEPDEYFIWQAVNNEKDGFKLGARKHFQRAASFGNTFGVFYAGLLYLQEGELVKGYAWLSMINTKRFPFASRVLDLVSKLEHQLSKEQITEAEVFGEKLEKYYGVEATFNRRLHWSKNFKLTGSNVRGVVPHGLAIQTDWTTSGTVSKMNANVKTAQLEFAIRDFVYEYQMDYRLTEGQVTLKNLEVKDQ